MFVIFTFDIKKIRERKKDEEGGKSRDSVHLRKMGPFADFVLT